MRIDKPPMLTGNNREDIAKLRGYLYRLTDELERAEMETTPTEEAPKETPKHTGIVKIYSSDTGLGTGSTIDMREDIIDAKFYTVVFIDSNNAENTFIPVILFKRGKYARGTVQVGGNTTTVTLQFANGKIRYNSGSISGYSLKEIYATVI